MLSSEDMIKTQKEIKRIMKMLFQLDNDERIASILKRLFFRYRWSNDPYLIMAEIKIDFASAFALYHSTDSTIELAEIQAAQRESRADLFIIHHKIIRFYRIARDIERGIRLFNKIRGN